MKILPHVLCAYNVKYGRLTLLAFIYRYEGYAQLSLCHRCNLYTPMVEPCLLCDSLRPPKVQVLGQNRAIVGIFERITIFAKMICGTCSLSITI